VSAARISGGKMIRVVALCCVFLLAAGIAAAGEKKLMHCFAFTALDSASDADWEAFYKATDALPSKIPGLTKVWYGKLRAPLMLASTTTGEDYKKLRAAKPGEEMTIPVRKDVRQYGVCMEMADEGTLKAYSDSPAHKDWEAAYGKVRRPGTTSFDILGQ
jgi:hypothetical protein